MKLSIRYSSEKKRCQYKTCGKLAHYRVYVGQYRMQTHVRNMPKINPSIGDGNMKRQEWITKAKEMIQSNNEFINEVNDMVGSDWSRHRSRMESAQRENEFLKQGIKLMTINTEELHDLINEEVCDELAEWGTTAKVSKYDNKENVPLRCVLNERCQPLMDKLYKRALSFLGESCTHDFRETPNGKANLCIKCGESA